MARKKRKAKAIAPPKDFRGRTEKQARIDEMYLELCEVQAFLLGIKVMSNPRDAMLLHCVPKGKSHCIKCGWSHDGSQIGHGHDTFTGHDAEALWEAAKRKGHNGNPGRWRMCAPPQEVIDEEIARFLLAGRG